MITLALLSLTLSLSLILPLFLSPTLTLITNLSGGLLFFDDHNEVQLKAEVPLVKLTEMKYDGVKQSSSPQKIDIEDGKGDLGTRTGAYSPLEKIRKTSLSPNWHSPDEHQQDNSYR
jgi:hypothetical protein